MRKFLEIYDQVNVSLNLVKTILALAISNLGSFISLVY